MADYGDILKRIDKAIGQFNKRIPTAQRAMFEEIELELKRLDLNGKRIKTTVANLKVITSIKNKLNRLIFSDDYKREVKAFVKAFNDITTLQHAYWKSVENAFKPSPLLKEIRKQAIGDTVAKLTESGIGANISDRIADILRTNITAGGSYGDLRKQLLNSLTDTDQSDGLLTRYAKQITVDSINQYNRQYTQAISNDLGYEWYAYQGTEIMTSRPFCQAMVEGHRYFHVSQIFNLLKGLDANGARLEYMDNKTGEIKRVETYSKTGLPAGFIPGTNPQNFFINAGGYQCGHAIRPVSERLVKTQAPELYDKIIASPAYKNWKK